MSKYLSVTSLALSVILSGAQLAVATTGPAGCLRDVRRTFVECGASCREDLQSAKDSCINKDHACVEGCRAGRAACVDASGLRVAINACDDTLAAARAICRDTPPPDQPNATCASTPHNRSPSSVATARARPPLRRSRPVAPPSGAASTSVRREPAPSLRTRASAGAMPTAPTAPANGPAVKTCRSGATPVSTATTPASKSAATAAPPATSRSATY